MAVTKHVEPSRDQIDLSDKSPVINGNLKEWYSHVLNWGTFPTASHSQECVGTDKVLSLVLIKMQFLH